MFKLSPRFAHLQTGPSAQLRYVEALPSDKSLVQATAVAILQLLNGLPSLDFPGHDNLKSTGRSKTVDELHLLTKAPIGHLI